MGPGYGNYDLRPCVPVPGKHQLWMNDDALGRLGGELTTGVVAIDSVPGVAIDALISGLRRVHPQARVIDIAERAAKSPDELDTMLQPHLTDDRLFGRITQLPLADFYVSERIQEIADQLEPDELTFLVGWGAALIPTRIEVLVLADLPRWETQLRQRAGAPNWGAVNHSEETLRKYKRSYFVEWRTADSHKWEIWDRIDLWLDTTDINIPKVVGFAGIADGLAAAAARPFRVMPYFDPGTWGGQWMREVCGLPSAPPNFAWCFDCVPEENSLLLGFGEAQIELPAQNLVQSHPRQLLGPRTHARFGPEFPIRFDMLDTMGGGNLSLQVHPLTGYIQDVFGMAYTQDESYYLLDAAPDAEVYLGLRSGIDTAQMTSDLRRAEKGEFSFPAEKYVNVFPARKHDHFSIPAGTVHCSGADSMVLEISATPYIFTFKMWDWDRLGLDGLPRPINIAHAERNIQWDRDTEWVEDNLIDQVEATDAGPGWREERTGLHELEFIETRRRWITGTAPYHTRDTVQVANLVAGAEAVIESPDGAFEPFVVHYAETFIVPAAVGAYTISPSGRALGTEIAVLTARVRGTERR